MVTPHRARDSEAIDAQVCVDGHRVEASSMCAAGGGQNDPHMNMKLDMLSELVRSMAAAQGVQVYSVQ